MCAYKVGIKLCPTARVKRAARKREKWLLVNICNMIQLWPLAFSKYAALFFFFFSFFLFFPSAQDRHGELSK